MLLGERAPRLTVDVANLHAPRVVHEHAEEILLWDGRFHDEYRPEKAEENEEKGREPDCGEHRAMPRGPLATRSSISQKRNRDGGDHHDGGDVRARRRHEAELALLKNDRPVIEQQPKDRIEHACSPVPKSS